MVPPRNGRHDREHIVDTALALLDRVGLADLTMRRLATELDVQPSALYWHVRDKQELLAAVADRILERVETPAGQDAVEETRLPAVARSVRDALLTYRDGAEVVLSTEALRLGSSHALEALSAALRHDDDIPRDDRAVQASATAVLHFILGHATLVQQQMHAESYGTAAEAGALAPTPDEVFEEGIRMLTAHNASRRMA